MQGGNVGLSKDFIKKKLAQRKNGRTAKQAWEAKSRYAVRLRKKQMKLGRLHGLEATPSSQAVSAVKLGNRLA